VYARPSGGNQTSWYQRAHTKITKIRSRGRKIGITMSFTVVFQTYFLLTVSRI